jgi:hypothetical protein
LNGSNQDPNGEVTVWFDDWDMAGAPTGTKTIYIPDENGTFSHLSILSNWGGGANTPASEMAVEIDHLEVWDAPPGG